MKKFKRPSITTVANLSIAFILIGLSVVVFATDISAIFLTVSAPVHNGNRNNQNVSIMFNVWGGNHARYIEPIMELLEEKGVGATFFVGGNWVSQNMALTKRIAEQFEIGNHAFTQSDMRTMHERTQRDEIRNTHEMIKTVTGKCTNLFAPPGGSFGRTTLRVAESFGYTTIMWSKDTIDWRDNDPDLIYFRATNNIMNGDMILMHPTAHTLAALPRILDYFAGRGFGVVRVSENIG